jgi:hypothetical protein
MMLSRELGRLRGGGLRRRRRIGKRRHPVMPFLLPQNLGIPMIPQINATRLHYHIPSKLRDHGILDDHIDCISIPASSIILSSPPHETVASFL